MRAVRSIIFILVCIGLVWLGVSLIRRALHSGNTTTPQVSTVKLSSAAAGNSSAELWVDGPIIANQLHRSVHIVVERTQVKMEVLSGYDGQVTAQRVFPNTEKSYLAFLKALETYQFTRVTTTGGNTDERGKCPSGNRYRYIFNNGNDTVVDAWSTSCNTGTYGGMRAGTRRLFTKQIPAKDYRELMKGVNLSF